MIKNDKGITLVSLTVTVIIILILVSIGMKTTYTTVNEARDNKFNTELGVIRQAITQQYMSAEAVGKTKISKDEPKVSFWVGTRIDDESKKMKLPGIEKINANSEIINFYNNAQKYNFTNQEDYYYRLTPSDQNDIGITNAKNTFIVNYKTGEVYNETKKITSGSDLLYLPSTLYNNDKIVDDTTFNDWSN